MYMDEMKRRWRRHSIGIFVDSVNTSDAITGINGICLSSDPSAIFMVSIRIFQHFHFLKYELC